MKIYKKLFSKITDSQNLFLAWDEFKHGKRHKPDVAIFELDLEQNIFDLHRDLKNGIYKHGPYEGFWIHDPVLRRIHKATVRDRVLHHALFSILNPVFEPTFINNSFSCRVGKGTHKGVIKAIDIMRAVSRNNTRSCYALKCDIRKFFDSVDHSILLSIIRRKIKDSQVIDLIEKIVRSYVSNNSGFAREREREREEFPSAI